VRSSGIHTASNSRSASSFASVLCRGRRSDDGRREPGYECKRALSVLQPGSRRDFIGTEWFLPYGGEEHGHQGRRAEQILAVR
jgi:hypothetical protein